MSEILSFPGLGLEFELDGVAFTVGGLPIYWYGVTIAAAFLLGALYVMRRVRAFGLDADRMMDVILGGVVLGIVCARLYYVAFSWDTYKDNPMLILNIRTGGIAIYGAIIGAVIATVLMCRWRRVKLLPTLDLGLGGVLLGQAVGRWGNFFNMEAFGSNTTLPWGMTSPTIVRYLEQNQRSLEAIGVAVDPQMPVHPTFFYESLWCLLGFLFIAWYTGRRRYDGELTLIYLGWYGLGRFFIEGLRTDSLLIGTIRVSQLLALLCVVASVIAMAAIRSRIRREGDPDYLPLYVNTDEGKAVLAGEFYKKKERGSGKKASETVKGEDGGSPEAEGEPVENEPAKEAGETKPAPSSGETEEQAETEEREDGKDY